MLVCCFSPFPSPSAQREGTRPNSELHKSDVVNKSPLSLPKKYRQFILVYFFLTVSEVVVCRGGHVSSFMPRSQRSTLEHIQTAAALPTTSTTQQHGLAFRKGCDSLSFTTGHHSVTLYSTRQHQINSFCIWPEPCGGLLLISPPEPEPLAQKGLYRLRVFVPRWRLAAISRVKIS